MIRLYFDSRSPAGGNLISRSLSPPCDNDHIESQEITQRLGNVVLPYVTSLLFISGNESSYTILHNATAGFIDTGSAKLLVTNAHVLQAFDKKLSDDSSLRLIIGGHGRTCIVDRNWLKDYYRKADLKLDLATFVLPDDVDPSIFGKAFYRPESWPPSRAAAGELVVIIGFQGVHRSQDGQNANMIVTVVADPVTTVNDTAFVLADEKLERVLDKIKPALGDLGAFGGMSGSPAFRFAENGDHWLAGFLFETHDGLNAQIRCVHADFVLPDGRLDYGLLPY